ncbi:MAG: transposase [Candidatus Micrarchaeaceae archaeon]
MEIYELKDKITELLAAARVIVQKFGHTKKFAKHSVAFVIKQHENFNDIKLVRFLRRDPIGKMLGYGRTFDETTFSKVRDRMEPEIMEELNNWIVEDRMKGRQLKLMSQDSTDIFAYSREDGEAKWGHRTPSRKEQLMQNGGAQKELFFGYKLHAIVDVETEIPIAVEIIPANTNDKKLFPCLYRFVKEKFRIQFMAKYLADAQYHSSKIRTALRDDNLVPVIPFSGNQWQKTEHPKDPDYGKRWAVEHVFSRLKEMFGMAKNRFIGLKRVRIHAYSCLLANLLEYVM